MLTELMVKIIEIVLGGLLFAASVLFFDWCLAVVFELLGV